MSVVFILHATIAGRLQQGLYNARRNVGSAMEHSRSRVDTVCKREKGVWLAAV
jgi:hypothetical protein